MSDKRERANEVCDFTAEGLISESPCSFSSPHEEAVVDIKDETFFEGICYKHSFSAFFFLKKKKFNGREISLSTSTLVWFIDLSLSIYK